MPTMKARRVERAERAVLLAAAKWWENKRPVAYDLNSHIHNPIINTSTDAEEGLARAVGELARLKVKREPQAKDLDLRDLYVPADPALPVVLPDVPVEPLPEAPRTEPSGEDAWVLACEPRSEEATEPARCPHGCFVHFDVAREKGEANG